MAHNEALSVLVLTGQWSLEWKWTLFAFWDKILVPVTLEKPANTFFCFVSFDFFKIQHDGIVFLSKRFRSDRLVEVCCFFGSSPCKMLLIFWMTATFFWVDAENVSLVAFKYIYIFLIKLLYHRWKIIYLPESPEELFTIIELSHYIFDHIEPLNDRNYQEQQT